MLDYQTMDLLALRRQMMAERAMRQEQQRQQQQQPQQMNAKQYLDQYKQYQQYMNQGAQPQAMAPPTQSVGTAQPIGQAAGAETGSWYPQMFGGSGESGLGSWYPQMFGGGAQAGTGGAVGGAQAGGAGAAQGAGGLGAFGWPAAIIAAAAIAGRAASHNTDLSYGGKPVGDITRGDIFTNPFENLMRDKFNIGGVHVGSKMDYNMKEGNWGRVIEDFPDLARSPMKFMEDGLGKVFGNDVGKYMSLPTRWMGDIVKKPFEWIGDLFD